MELRDSSDREEEKARKRIAKAEKKALKLTGVDHGLVQRFWELVSIFPKISQQELANRLERFILFATADQYYRMQQALFMEGTPYMLEDPRVLKVVNDLKGKSIGLSVPGVYDSTITLDDICFKVDKGIKEGVPVLSVMSRRDYADIVLRLKDPVKMLLARRIRATHKLTLLKWAIPHLDLVREHGLLEKYFSYQPAVEEMLDEKLKEMGY
jgi:hypothetical protein